MAHSRKKSLMKFFPKMSVSEAIIFPKLSKYADLQLAKFITLNDWALNRQISLGSGHADSASRISLVCAH